MPTFKIIVIVLISSIGISSCDTNSTNAIPKTQPDPIAANHPFPQHTPYTGDHIKPNNNSQADLDNHTSSFYDQWKANYLKNDCSSKEYYVHVGNGSKTVSEAHGYGMMITCYMAGYDSNAKSYFDGLYYYYKSHPSVINNRLMDWQQLSCNDATSDGNDSASDGDIDIAFALLLAHNQWGSTDKINYLEEAKLMIEAILQDDVNPSSNTIKLGDWSSSSNSNYYFGTRTSDFIISHFRAFKNTTDNSKWTSIINRCYSLLRTNQNSETGLVPDFIINTNTASTPAGENYLESIYDGNYYYNACRVPWRIGSDYLISGDSRAKSTLIILNKWLSTSTEQNAHLISNGYMLDGTPIYDWNDATYLGPFTVSAMLETNNQEWLNMLYDELINGNKIADGDYYSNTIKLLSLLTISGNYWQPTI